MAKQKFYFLRFDQKAICTIGVLNSYLLVYILRATLYPFLPLIGGVCHQSSPALC